MSETAPADGRVIHGEKIEIEAAQVGKESGRRSQGEARAEDSRQEEDIDQKDIDQKDIGQKDIGQKDQGRGEEKEADGGGQKEAIRREDDRCPQSSGRQEKEAIREARKTFGTRRENR